MLPSAKMDLPKAEHHQLLGLSPLHRARSAATELGQGDHRTVGLHIGSTRSDHIPVWGVGERTLLQPRHQ